MRFTFVVHPIETRLDGESCQHAISRSLRRIGCYINGSTLVVQRCGPVPFVFGPGFGDTQFDAGPLVHNRHGQRVQFLLAALLQRRERETGLVRQSFLFVLASNCLLYHYICHIDDIYFVKNAVAVCTQII